MEEVIKPKVKVLGTGEKYVAKQMEGRAGFLLPDHQASVESIMFIHEGECFLKINGKDILLKAGDAFVVPPHVRHQFKGITDFKGIHFMPKEIQIEYFD